MTGREKMIKNLRLLSAEVIRLEEEENEMMFQLRETIQFATEKVIKRHLNGTRGRPLISEEKIKGMAAEISVELLPTVLGVLTKVIDDTARTLSIPHTVVAGQKGIKGKDPDSDG